MKQGGNKHEKKEKDTICQNNKPGVDSFHDHYDEWSICCGGLCAFYCKVGRGMDQNILCTGFSENF